LPLPDEDPPEEDPPEEEPPDDDEDDGTGFACGVGVTGVAETTGAAGVVDPDAAAPPEVVAAEDDDGVVVGFAAGLVDLDDLVALVDLWCGFDL
jgi:hypothetical protein